MSIFDLHETKFPKGWGEMSFENKLQFVFLSSMMAMVPFGNKLTIASESLFVAALLLIFTALSMRRRRAAGWRWPGARPRDVAGAIFAAGIAGFFVFAASAMLGFNPLTFGMYCFTGAIGLFGALESLKITHLTELEFKANCQRQGAGSIQDAARSRRREPRWKEVTRDVIIVATITVGLAGTYQPYFLIKIVRDGSRTPTATNSELISDHGRFVYITKRQRMVNQFLKTVPAFVFPEMLALALAIHFFAGVRIFPGLTTLEEMRKRRSLKA